MKDNPNPQGKGLVPLLEDWAALRPSALASRPAPQFLRDYCLSSLVIAAAFNFKPVIGNTYYLYSREHDWMLSLVSPGEWGARVPGEFVAACTMRPDITWTLDFSATQPSRRLQDKLAAYLDGFIDAIEGQQSVAANLPDYVAHLPYYRRLVAAGLAASLRPSAAAVENEVRILLQQADPRRALLPAQAFHRDHS